MILFLDNSAKAATLEIGIIAPLSGAGAPWRKALVEGVEMAIDDVEKDGCLKIKGEKYGIEVIPYDDRYTGWGGIQKVKVRHPPQSGWLDEWGCLKGS